MRPHIEGGEPDLRSGLEADKQSSELERTVGVEFMRTGQQDLPP